jgi:uncharacterized protein YciI
MTSVKKQIVVEASQQRAFRVFTDGIDRWWPREHHIGASPLERMILEPYPGGRWYETTPEGMAKVPEHIAGHIARLDLFQARGTLLMAGPLLDASGRALGVFTSRAAAEEFIAGDPFVVHGVVSSWTVVEWKEVLA